MLYLLRTFTNACRGSGDPGIGLWLTFQEVSGGLEAIIKTRGENDLVAIAKYYSRDPKVFAIGMFDAVIMLKALTTVLEMTEPMLKKIRTSRRKSVWKHKMRCCIASSTKSEAQKDQLASKVSAFGHELPTSPK